MAVSLEVQGDSDAHPVRAEDQVVKYCLKYVSKVSKDDGTRDGKTAKNHRAKDSLLLALPVFIVSSPSQPSYLFYA